VERAAKGREWGDAPTFEVSSKTAAGVDEVFTRAVQAVLAGAVDPGKGGAGGSVMGAGRTPAQASTEPKKDKKCTII
jgi:hypothetical protein